VKKQHEQPMFYARSCPCATPAGLATSKQRCRYRPLMVLVVKYFGLGGSSASPIGSAQCLPKGPVPRPEDVAAIQFAGELSCESLQN
jgi:hypothetical protein